MSIYLDRYAWESALFPNYTPDPSLEMVVVIPCYNERKIEKVLLSLNTCAKPCNFLVLVVVNESTDEEPIVQSQNLTTIQTIENLKPKLDFEILIAHRKLLPKKAGVGLARKIGMDESVRFFEKLKKDGIIVCYDADCTCQENYLAAIYEFYQEASKEAGIVFHEHNFNANKNAVIKYEIYLRYYVNALRYARFPHAYQTLGSCITVKSKRYQKDGGMNTRKAGEDFYFLHKVIPNGKFGEINSTTIFPSDRISDRVPFGTGHAIDKYLNQESDVYLTYSPKIFEELKSFFSQVEILYSQESPSLSPCVKRFLNENGFDPFYSKMLKQSTDLSSFKKQFFAWMDGFRVLKFVHFARDHFDENVELMEAVNWLDKQLEVGLDFSSEESVLEGLREFDRDYTSK
ncbi:MAG: glycosyltransferase family 2 protein [Cytophagales bacterium]|nr:glycosyltransferase family 2 protein [Cytophagales bacterium]